MWLYDLGHHSVCSHQCNHILENAAAGMTPIWIPPAILLRWEKLTYLFCVQQGIVGEMPMTSAAISLPITLSRWVQEHGCLSIPASESIHPIVRLPALPFRAVPHRPSRLGHMFDRGSLVLPVLGIASLTHIVKAIFSVSCVCFVIPSKFCVEVSKSLTLLFCSVTRYISVSRSIGQYASQMCQA
jgi:hypothetical protein